MHTTTESASAAAEQILSEMTMPDGIQAEVLASDVAMAPPGHVAYLVAWGPATFTCPGCGQRQRPAERPCPVDIDTGAFGDLRMWSHHHGCGVWWSPPWTSRDLSSWEPSEEGVREVVEELAQEVDERDEAAAAEVERDLRQALTDALAELAAGGDVPDYLQGSEMQPGVWCHGEEWEAWDWDPREPEGGEAIVVTEREVAQR